MKTWEQTADDMDARFSGGFQAAGGNSQSLAFMMAAVCRLPDMFKPLMQFEWTEKGHIIEGLSATIADYGCALGDGTAILQAAFPLSKVIGYDISPKAVEIASTRWPHIQFEVGDITAPKSHAIAFASHVVEHMQYPAEVVKGLIEKHQITVIIVPPIPYNAKYETHKGAQPTKDWLVELPKPLHQALYNTVRSTMEDVDHICEGNSMYIWYNEDYSSHNS